jgi:hypothetical protein
MSALAFKDLMTAISSRVGVHDLACPLCGPQRRSPTNQARKVLRVWNISAGFVTFHCARCGESGFAQNGLATPVDPIVRARLVGELSERSRAAKEHQLSKALRLWRARQPLLGSIGEKYLREARAYHGPIPSTLGFLPARADYPPAMIAPFGLPEEPEPGALVMPDDRIVGIHLTRLFDDGSDRIRREKAKIMIGSSCGNPIMVAPWTDGQALIVTEGIEDALSAHETTGMCAWAAGCASRLPALAYAVPSWVESVTILADNNHDGRRHATTLAANLSNRKIEVRVLVLGVSEAA